MDIILIAGLWLDASAWDAVEPPLRALGHRPVPVSLPGQGAPPDAATLDDQLAAVLAAIDAADGEVMVVGHSAASTLAWMAADARPQRLMRAVLVGGCPVGDGATYVDEFELSDGVLPFPGWDPFEAAVVADLDPTRRDAIAAAAIPVPEAVARATVRLGDERRYGVPVTIVCPEFSPADVQGWIAEGEVPELARASAVDYIDIDSGHWPMFTQPEALARLLAGLAVSRA